MAGYKVKWEIVLDADSSLEAAKKALAMIVDPKSKSHAFEVATSESVEDAEEFGDDPDLCYGLEDLDDISPEERVSNG